MQYLQKTCLQGKGLRAGRSKHIGHTSPELELDVDAVANVVDVDADDVDVVDADLASSFSWPVVLASTTTYGKDESNRWLHRV